MMTLNSFNFNTTSGIRFGSGQAKDACKKMASDAMKQTRLLVNNPREVTEADALNIYQSAW